MLSASWFRRLTTGSPTRSRRPGRRPTLSRRSVLPRLEALEVRSLLSTFTVTNLLDSGAGSLRAGILSGDSTIAFARGLHGTVTLTSGELLISDSVTINGPGANHLSVSGNSSSRVFEIAGGQNVAMNGLTITNGQTVAANGGGILIDAGATLNLDQVVVANNSAYADSSGNNYGSGGGIENDGSLTVAESIFTNNLASGGNFTNPITEGSAGGAIDSAGPSLTVTTSAFTNNQAVGPATGTGEGNGGAINNSSNATITDSTFKGNLALGRTTNGGAISTGENELTNPATDPLAISNCTFTANQAIGANGTNNFTHKYGGQALGGAIANAAPLTITASTFTDNLAKAGDQGNNLNGIDGEPLVGSAYGGGIVNFASSLMVTNTTFIGNRAIAGNSATGVGGSAVGGGVCGFIFSVPTLTNVTLVSNQAIGGSGGPGYTGGSGFGGGFYNGVDSTAAVSDALFFENQAGGGAGGNGATGGVGAGGAIANGGGTGALEVAFLGLGTDTSSLSLAGSALIFNVAQGGAGGAGGNGGSGLGGGLFADAVTTAAISNSLLVLNHAIGGEGGSGGTDGNGFGGGIYVTSGASVSLKKTTVALNVASTSNNDIDGTVTYL
ncbi:MAG: beta strand repeat-containing protein [Isosphaerales bacterium]